MGLDNIKESIEPFIDGIKQLHQLLEIELDTSSHFFETGHSGKFHKLEEVKWHLSDCIKLLEHL